MRPFPNHRILLGAILLLAVVSLLQPTAATYIDSLTYEQLLATVGSTPTLLIFTAQWCDHSAALASEIKALAVAARKASGVVIARVDADDEPALPARFEVNAYPTILFFEKGFPLTDKSRRPVEFVDYRWAEIIAEFVNNRSQKAVLSVPPRAPFLKWREQNPFNKGEQPVEDNNSAGRDAIPEGAFDDLGVTTIREPLALHVHNFEEQVSERRHVRVLTLFYTPDDPFNKDLLVQWRQASSAFTGADNVTLALVDLSLDGNDALREKLLVKDTPACLYFPRCEDMDGRNTSRNPQKCPEELNHTENIIQFLSNKVMTEMGLSPDTDESATGETYTLTEEQYQQMKQDGVVFANDPQQQDKMRELYKKHASQSFNGGESVKEEL